MPSPSQKLGRRGSHSADPPLASQADEFADPIGKPLRRPAGQTLHVIRDVPHAAFADRPVRPHDERDESLRQSRLRQPGPQRIVVEMDDLDARLQHPVQDGNLRFDRHRFGSAEVVGRAAGLGQKCTGRRRREVRARDVRKTARPGRGVESAGRDG
jgi:hypothetical protein